MVIRLSLLFSIFFLLAACKNDRKAEVKEAVALPQPQYYYFPKANVYFDSTNKDYVFLANDGKTWQTEKSIPAAMHALMDKSAYIENPAQPVWNDNERHKLVYSSLLYASSTDTVEKKKPIIAKRRVSASPVTEEKKKQPRGIRKFFNKLLSPFKKDKKEKNENNDQAQK